MADILMKSVTYPDLEDRYIIGDTSLNVAGAAADSKTTGDKLATKANVDGSYENLTAGNAKQLVSNVRANDKVPYLFRTSGGSVDIGDREFINGIVGGTVAWNQLVADSVKRITFTPNGSAYYYNGIVNLACPANHVLFVSGTYTYNGAKTIMPYLQMGNSGSGRIDGSAAISATPQVVCGVVKLITSIAQLYPSVYNTDRATVLTAEDAYTVDNLMVTDLTQMFGSTIADYIYSLEQATAGAGVAWFKKHFPKSYYAYNAGQLMSVKALRHITRGFNAWDEEWEAGGVDNITGQPITDSNKIRSKNFIPILPSTSYYAYIGNSGALGVRYYDADKNFIGIDSYAKNAVFVTPSNASFMKFANGSSDAPITTYNHDICINLSWDGSRDGEYEPYEFHSYPLDSDLTLRGIPKLDANNNLYYDGDVYEADGTVQRRYREVDLGTLSWIYQSDNTRFYTSDLSVNNKIKVVDNSYVFKGICTKYAINSFGAYSDKQISASQTGNLFVKDSAYTDAATFKTAMSGVYLVYELATPTTETADPYTSPQIVNDFGTEEYVLDDNAFPVPVGHDTDYPINLVAKLEMAPNSPDGNGDYIVRQTNGTNEYVPLVIEDALPTIPSTAGSYKLTVTVAEGEDPVLSWEAE